MPTTNPNIQISPDTVSSFRVTWQEIPIEHRHGVIDRYKLWYGTPQKLIVLELDGDTRTYLVTGKNQVNSPYLLIEHPNGVIDRYKLWYGNPQILIALVLDQDTSVTFNVVSYQGDSGPKVGTLIFMNIHRHVRFFGGWGS